MHSAGLVLQDKLNGTQSTLVTSAHPLGPAQSSLHSLPCGLINLLQPFLCWPCLHRHLLHTPTCQPGTSTSRAEQERSDPSSLPEEPANIWLGPPASRSSSQSMG